MDLDRRTALRLAAIGAGTSLAGCLGTGGDGETPTDTPTETPPETGPAVIDSATRPFDVSMSRPGWDEEETTGYVVIADSEKRQRAALDLDELSEERREDVREFLGNLDYGTDRLVFVESIGPDTCHSRLDIGNIRLEDGGLRADATVADTSGENEGCGDAIVYPSALLRVRFDGAPPDEAALDVTDGWDEQATVTASVDDPLSVAPGDLPGHVRPDEDPEPIAPLECDDEGVKRHSQWFDEADVQWGDFEYEEHDSGEHGSGGPHLSLRVADLEYEYGDTVEIDLTNVADVNVETGNSAKYNVQVYTEDGWQDLRVRDEDEFFEYTDEAVSHAPGEGFTWSFEFTEEGIVEGSYHDDAEVCPDLQSGRYRFAYFGVIGDGAVAVSFDLDLS